MADVEVAGLGGIGETFCDHLEYPTAAGSTELAMEVVAAQGHQREVSPYGDSERDSTAWHTVGHVGRWRPDCGPAC